MNTHNLNNAPEPKGWLDMLDTVYLAVQARILAVFDTLDAHPSGGLVGMVGLVLIVVVVMTMCVGLMMISHPAPAP